MKKVFAIVCVLGLLVLAILRHMYGEVFSDSIRSQLKVGMTTNEVRAILGPPSSISPSGHCVYIKPLMYNVGLVYFDDSGHFTSAIND